MLTVAGWVFAGVRVVKLPSIGTGAPSVPTAVPDQV
ncbi:Uncharacterised protein [Mycobacteroides abscessus subsp. abscessus]|nr:Uncharacterised protein [Mycobacteroides abscessus subsp. abscessus]